MLPRGRNMALSPLDFEQVLRNSHSITEGALNVLDHVWNGKAWTPAAQPLQEGGSVVVSGVLQADDYVWDGKAWVAMVQPVQEGGSLYQKITKTIQTELAALAQINANAIAVSSVLDVSLASEGTIFIDFSPITTSAPAAGTEFRIEASEKASGDDTWRPLAVFRTGTVAALTATCGDEAAGQTVIEFNPTPAWSLGDIIFFKNSTLASSEWARVAAISSNVSVTVMDPITNHQNASALYNKAEHFVAVLDLRSITRLRVTAHNNLHANSYNCVWRVAAITGS